MSADARRVVPKARRNPGFVPWGVAILVGGFFLGSLLASSPAAAIPPVVKLFSPTGGEDWTGGSTHSLVWSVSDFGSPLVPYWINVSANNGSTWSPFTNASVIANGANHSTAWPVPYMNTTSMRVQICAARNGTSCAASLSFRVDSTPPVATPTPANGQAGVDPRSVVRLDFSEPMQTTPPPLTSVVFTPSVAISSVNWTTSFQLTVTHSVFALATTYTWYVNCSIRDASGPGNPLAGCGAPMWSFTTAANVPPAVGLSSPVGGEDWTGGTVHAIGWSVSDPDTPSVTYAISASSDNGSSWSTLSNGSAAADGSSRSFPWSTPLLSTASMRVRVCASDNTTLVCASSTSFRVDSTRPVAVPLPLSGTGSVARNAFVSVSFSEPMQTTSLPLSAVTFVPAVSVLSLTWASPSRLIVGHADFAPSTDYTWYVDCSLQDASSPGNTVAGCGSSAWSFRTNTPPSAVSLAVDGFRTPPETQRIPNDRMPTFTWTFLDPDANASQQAYEWQVVDPGSGNIVSASGVQYGTAAVSTYSGPLLLPRACYLLNLRVFDGLDWSSWAPLDFCIAPEAQVVLRPLVIPFVVVPVSITIVLLSAVVAVIWPRWYRVAEVTGVAQALLALLMDVSLMILSLQPLQLDLSPALVAAAVLIMLPVVVQFLPESAGAALDPEPGTKILSHGLFGAAMGGLGVYAAPLLGVAAVSVAADADLGASIGSRLWAARRHKPPAS